VRTVSDCLPLLSLRMYILAHTLTTENVHSHFLLPLPPSFQVPTTIDQRVVLVHGAAYVHVQTANNTKWAITMTFVLVWRARVEQQGFAPKAAFPQPAEA